MWHTVWHAKRCPRAVEALDAPHAMHILLSKFTACLLQRTSRGRALDMVGVWVQAIIWRNDCTLFIFSRVGKTDKRRG